MAGCATLRAGLGSAPRGGCDPSGRRLVAAPAGSQSEPDPGAAGELLKATIKELPEETLTELRAPTGALFDARARRLWPEPYGQVRASGLRRSSFMVIDRLRGRGFRGCPRLAL